MQNRCRQCQYLIESDLISDPHSGLQPLLNQRQAQLYRCDFCSSCFIFTDQDVSLVMLNTEDMALIKAVSA